MNIHPNNITAHYIKGLPCINLSGGWECGMVEFQYTHTWYTLRREDTSTSTSLRVLPRVAGLIVLMHHVNKALAHISTDNVKAKMNYSNICKKNYPAYDTGFRIYHALQDCDVNHTKFSPVSHHQSERSGHTRVRVPEPRRKGSRSHTVGELTHHKRNP